MVNMWLLILESKGPEHFEPPIKDLSLLWCPLIRVFRGADEGANVDPTITPCLLPVPRGQRTR